MRKKNYYYLPGNRNKSRVTAYVIAGIVIFVGIFFPLYAINLRYQVGYVFSKVFDTIGMFCLTIGTFLTAISILGLFFQRSMNIRYFLLGVVLLWVGCWTTGNVIELFGVSIGTEPASGGYHFSNFLLESVFGLLV